jgi:hypothetical protein
MLHRPSEVSGFDPCLGVLGSKGETLASVRSAYSESAENQAGLLGVIGNGFAYTPFARSVRVRRISFSVAALLGFLFGASAFSPGLLHGGPAPISTVKKSSWPNHCSKADDHHH